MCRRIVAIGYQATEGWIKLAKAPRNNAPRRSGPEIDQELNRLDDLDSELIGTVHDWCPACDGSGMAMDLGGQPGDCPNLQAHRMINGALRPMLMSKKEAARLVGVDARSLNRHMALRRLPYQIVGGVAVFLRLDVLRFKKAYWY